MTPFIWLALGGVWYFLVFVYLRFFKADSKSPKTQYEDWLSDAKNQNVVHSRAIWS